MLVVVVVVVVVVVGAVVAGKLEACTVAHELEAGTVSAVALDCEACTVPAVAEELEACTVGAVAEDEDGLGPSRGRIPVTRPLMGEIVFSCVAAPGSTRRDGVL